MKQTQQNLYGNKAKGLKSSGWNNWLRQGFRRGGSWRQGGATRWKKVGQITRPLFTFRAAGGLRYKAIKLTQDMFVLKRDRSERPWNGARQRWAGRPRRSGA